MGQLDDLLARIKGRPAEELEQLNVDADAVLGDKIWVPNPGPQTEAYFSTADVLLYGGAAGSGKSQLSMGWAINEAQRGIIFRRELSQTDGLESDGKAIIGNVARFNGSDLEWTWPSGKTLKLGGMQNPDSWISHAGRERDLMAFDEAGEFLESQVSSIIAWLRAPKGVRTRLILASNPPRTSDGLWLLKWFGPWLDETFPNPAVPGELRWGVYVKDKIVWVDGPETTVVDGDEYIPKSYTFIPASLEDNPFRNTPEYRAQLMSLPGVLRAQLLYGDWKAGLKDDADQLIPTAWVRAANERWQDKIPDVPMCAMGVDASGGGDDPMCIAKRYDAWFDRITVIPGENIPMDRAGSYAAALVVAERMHGALPVIDVGGGYGGPVYEHLMQNGITCVAFKGSEASEKRSRDKTLRFVNLRSAAYWLFREALDPDQPGGSPVALPPDPKLMAGLTAPRFEVTPRGVQVEPKSRHKGGKGIKERLGFSPDEADAVVMCWWTGPKETSHALEWAEHKINRSGQSRAIMRRR